MLFAFHSRFRNNVKHIKKARKEFHYASFRVHGNFVPFDFLPVQSVFLLVRVVLSPPAFIIYEKSLDFRCFLPFLSFRFFAHTCEIGYSIDKIFIRHYLFIARILHTLANCHYVREIL